MVKFLLSHFRSHQERASHCDSCHSHRYIMTLYPWVETVEFFLLFLCCLGPKYKTLHSPAIFNLILDACLKNKVGDTQ